MWGTKSLPVHWVHQGVVGGLVRAHVTLPPPDGRAWLAVDVDGTEVLRTAEWAVVDGEAWLNVHTPLLPEGKVAIRVRASLPSGLHEAEAVFTVRNEGALAVEVRTALKEVSAPTVFLGNCDASMYREAQRRCTAWVDAPDAEARVDAWVAEGRITRTEADQLRRFLRDGFVVLDDPLPRELVAQANADIDEAVRTGYQGYRYGDSTRLEQMHQSFAGIRAIWLHPPVHRFLSLVFGVPSRPCQSLVYVFGSQQDAHQDTVHLTPFPAGRMCGVWAALEAVREGSGELMVYPGSHRWPRVYMDDVGCAKVRGGQWAEFGEKVVGRWESMIRESGVKPVPYLAKPGQILVWHENLMHAGSVRRDPSLTRRSVVTHHFADGALAYYDSSGMAGILAAPTA